MKSALQLPVWRQLAKQAGAGLRSYVEGGSGTQAKAVAAPRYFAKTAEPVAYEKLTVGMSWVLCDVAALLRAYVSNLNLVPVAGDSSADYVAAHCITGN